MVTPNSPCLKRLLGTAIALSLLAAACSPGKQQGGAGGPPAFQVKMQAAAKGLVSDSSEYVGNLEAKQRVRLAPRIDGRILRIFVDSGERVAAGQKIVELQPTREQENVRAAASQVNIEKANLNARQADLRAAEAERARAEAQVEEARANLARADADVQDIQAELELAQKNYARFVFLVKEGAQSQQDLDNRTRDLNTRKAQLASRIKTRDSLRGSLNASVKSLQAAEKRVEQALANIDSQKAAVARAEGQLGVSSQMLGFNTVTAPINGIVGDFPSKVGDYVEIGEELTTITNNQTFDLRISVPTERRAQLRTGLPVETIDADGKVAVKGQVTFISPNVNNSNQTILAKATFRNDGSLRDNQYVKARIVWGQQPGVLIPTTAVTRIGGQAFVFVAQQAENQQRKPTLVAKQKPVILGSIQGQDYAVRSGIKAGEKVITSGLLNLQDGTPVAQETIASEQKK
ncbi:MAG: efflux RND transporter periplasmic adaptor subunit [Hydrococcus sp. C42_A2020_068]|uniref:efflux RND transporter periplasmic adaptor subunit n=1 Tax=Pleurocapsa sp. PCC 7327 TaxID=118163 RepID=UPI00029FE7F2|nr:efflux RND transporter periplasmic adaptor subunit [Pleurocapsa sp. PCC 7327]AFY77533.1 RND family efflux transporter, MFP subunit [Pleurocapsa sp. PCC 7327]MBF2019434.1 efflux RND transporter periplasmic adaptor subunit [Hydrococcus sp. C42_A2020_068]